MVADTFSTISAPLHLGAASDLLFKPDGLLAHVLSYAGPEGIAKLRSFPMLRKRMSFLPISDLVRVGLPASINKSLDELIIQFLRNHLVEYRWEECSHGSRAIGNQCEAGRRIILSPKETGRKEDRRLNHLGLLALAHSTLASDVALRRLCALPPKYCNPETRLCVCEAVANNPGSSAAALDLLVIQARQGGQRYSRILAAVALHGNTTPATLASLASNNLDRALLVCVARNPHTSTETLSSICQWRLQERTTAAVLTHIATHRNVAISDLRCLASYPDAHVRAAVASNSYAPLLIPSALNALSSDAALQVRLAVASNPFVTCDVLLRLSHDKNRSIRESVARNPASNQMVLAQLARDETGSVREAVASNTNTSVETLFGDAHNIHHQPILAKHATSPGLLTLIARINDEEEIQESLAGNIYCPTPILSMLAKSDNHIVRELVACHPRAPIAVLAELSSDPTPHVRASVARNITTPADVLAVLVSDHDEQVREFLADNSHTSAETLEALARATLTKLGRRGDRHGCDESSVLLFKKIAKHANTSVVVLETMSRSKYSHLRATVASNPRLPVSCLTRLCLDPKDSVNESLAKNVTVQRVAEEISCFLPGPQTIM